MTSAPLPVRQIIFHCWIYIWPKYNIKNTRFMGMDMFHRKQVLWAVAGTACLPLSNSAYFLLCWVTLSKLLIWQRIKRDIYRLECVTEFLLLWFVGRRQRSATGRYFCSGRPNHTGSGTLLEVVVIYVCCNRILKRCHVFVVSPARTVLTRKMTVCWVVTSCNLVAICLS
jgi:hypothetical protein